MSFLPLCLPSSLESTRLPSINHALISPSVHHPNLLRGTSSISSIDSPFSSFITPSSFHFRLKLFLFCKSFPLQICSRTDYMNSLSVTVTSQHIHFYFVFSGLHFLFVVAERYIKLTQVGYRAHVKNIIVSYRIAGDVILQ